MLKITYIGNEGRDYPCLKRASAAFEYIVLFNSARAGTVVAGNSPTYRVGHYSENWDLCYFVPWHGTVTLEG